MCAGGGARDSSRRSHAARPGAHAEGVRGRAGDVETVPSTLDRRLGVRLARARQREQRAPARRRPYYLGPGDSPAYAVVNAGARYRAHAAAAAGRRRSTTCSTRTTTRPRNSARRHLRARATSWRGRCRPWAGNFRWCDRRSMRPARRPHSGPASGSLCSSYCFRRGLFFLVSPRIRLRDRARCRRCRDPHRRRRAKTETVFRSSRRAAFCCCFSCFARSRARLFCVGLDFCNVLPDNVHATSAAPDAERRPPPPPGPRPPPPPPLGLGRASFTAILRPSRSLSFSR